MKLHHILSNAECIGHNVCAEIEEGQPWVTYEDGGNIRNHYRDVFVNGFCVYMDGENCRIVDFNTTDMTVTMFSFEVEHPAYATFTIPYEQYLADFGTTWAVYDEAGRLVHARVA